MQPTRNIFPARERGSVTILVLWGMVIVFALLAAAGFTARTETQIARNAVASARVRQAAEGGTQLGLARLLARRAAGRTLFDGKPETWQDGAVTVSIAIQDEAGKIDLNQAPPELLEGLFAAAGRPDGEALLLACRIVERRGGPPCLAPVGDDPTARRAAQFAAPEELAALPGMGDRLYTAIADFVTVATGATAVDPAVAPRTVLLALPGATSALVDAYLAGRAAQQEMEPEGSGFESLPGYAYLMVSPLRDFTISAVATSHDGARYRADLQLRLTGQAVRPYEVIAWRTPPLGPDTASRR
jgi:general secretion pathway protein K